MKKNYLIEVVMPSGEKLTPIEVDRDAFLLGTPSVVGAHIGDLIAKLIERRLKA